MNNEQIVLEALDIIEKSRAEAGEVYLIDSQGTEIKVLKGEVENLQFSEEKGIGVRVLQRNKIGFSFTSDLRKEGLKKVVREALANSTHTFQDPVNGFPGPAGELSSVQCYDPSQEEVSLKEKIALAQTIEKSAAAYDPRITAFYETAYKDRVGQVFIANTEGVNYSFLLSRCVGATDLVATDESGSQQWGDESDFALSIFGLSPKEIGEKAAQEAIAKLGAKQYDTKKVDLVLSPKITVFLFGAFLPAFYADNILKGKSLFREKLGQKIASDKVTLIDDGRLKGRAGTKPVDGEGIATRETVLINQGRLISWLHSFYTSRRMNVEPTGNARRSYSGPPIIGPTNLYLKPGSISKEKLISEVKDGLYINSVMGHNISPISGEFSLGASGIVIEKGEFTYPVERIAIAGNIIDLLNSVVEVANDLRFFIDGSGGCTILLEGISVSGK